LKIRKYRNIARYPYVSLLIDKRTNDKKDFKKYQH
jgi:hypothetical protein